jgi:hypothetical protein
MSKARMWFKATHRFGFVLQTAMIPISVLPPALLALISLTAPTHAFSWPFGQKRYTQEGLISAGNLGIAAGRIVGLGDWNGDQSYAALSDWPYKMTDQRLILGFDQFRLDIFTLSSDQKTVSLRLWDPSRSLPGLILILL